MGEVLFVLHPRVSPENPAVGAAARVLEERGIGVDMYQRVEPVEKPSRYESDPEMDAALVPEKRLVVTFGGDGTFLHAARTAVNHGVPMLGVNMGRLGFLTWCDLTTAGPTLTAWAEGRKELERRETLEVVYAGISHLAINEAALLKDPPANVIQVVLSLDGEVAGMFHADGAVLASPTGSTAYSASAGGPILDPRTHAMVLSPLAPHTLATRGLVLPGDVRVELSVDEPTRLVLDGATRIDVEPDTSVEATLSGPTMEVVKVPGGDDFYGHLRDKMRWGEPLVREGRR